MWTQRKAVKYLRDWKESRFCVDCRLYYRYFQIEADHVRGLKLFNLGSREAAKLTEAALIAELAKCEARCRNCHALQTWARLRGSQRRVEEIRRRGRHLPPGASLTPWNKAVTQSFTTHRNYSA